MNDFSKLNRTGNTDQSGNLESVDAAVGSSNSRPCVPTSENAASPAAQNMAIRRKAASVEGRSNQTFSLSDADNERVRAWMHSRRIPYMLPTLEESRRILANKTLPVGPVPAQAPEQAPIPAEELDEGATSMGASQITPLPLSSSIEELKQAEPASIINNKRYQSGPRKKANETTVVQEKFNLS